MTENQVNQRVTNAQIWAALDALNKRFPEWKGEIGLLMADHEARLRVTEALLQRHDAELKNINSGATVKSVVSGGVFGVLAFLASLLNK